MKLFIKIKYQTLTLNTKNYFQEHVDTSIADEGTECLDSNVHSNEAVPESEGSHADGTSHTSTDFDEVGKCFGIF